MSYKNEFNKILKAMQAAGELGYIWNPKDDTLEWLGDFMAFTDEVSTVPPETSADLHVIVHEKDLVDRMRTIKVFLAQADVSPDTLFDNEFRFRSKEGKEFWIHDTARIIADEESDEYLVYGVLRRLGAAKITSKTLERHMNRDSLTGYFKRDAFCAHVKEMRDLNRKMYGAVMVLGIDRLSLYNAAIGAEATNKVIKAVGHHIESLIHDYNFDISRIGGDRFAIFVNGMEREDIHLLAARILNSFSTIPLITKDGPIRVSVSMGSSYIDREARSFADVLTQAETALQLAKDQGRGCHVPYVVNVDDEERYRTWLETGNDLVIAMNGNRIVLAYQPVVDAKNGEIAFHECLVRMIAPTGEVVNAQDFIPAVEHLGLSRIMDTYVMQKAVSVLADNPFLSFSINVSAYSISDENWMREFKRLMRMHKGLGERVIIEVTETVAMTDMDRALHFVESIQEEGARIALDDFGAGHTSFGQIQKLGVDIVKIDRAFIAGLQSSESNQTFVAAMQSIAKSQNILTVGEGAEDDHEVEMLRQFGVDYIQGFAFGRPEVGSFSEKSDEQKRLI